MKKKWYNISVEADDHARVRFSSQYGVLNLKARFISFTFSFFPQGGFIMYSYEVTVEIQVGLHARPATFFIQKANEFKSSIWVEKEERRANAKSLLGVLSLGITGGTDIKILADGQDEQEAVDALTKLVVSGVAE